MKLTYEVEDKPPFGTSLLLALQHMLAAMGAIIAVPLVVGSAIGLPTNEMIVLVNAALLVSGVVTIIQCKGVGVIGIRLPVVMGTSFTFVAISISIGIESGVAAIFGASAGLMIIANITSIASEQGNIIDGAYLVVALAIFNSGGRLATGLLSDKIGSIKTLALAMLLQLVNMLLFAQFDSSFTLILGAGLAGIGYGALLAVFPSVMAELYGLKNFGTNYGILYTAWGVGGFIGPVLAGWSVDTFGTYDLAYSTCAVLVFVC